VCSLSFEELVVTDRLTAAVLTPACCLQYSVKDRFIEHFPQTTKIDLLMKKVCFGDIRASAVVVIVSLTVISFVTVLE